jgi:hypothetical protein
MAKIETNWNRKPNPGESLHMRSTSRYSSPHCHALYLGEDATGDKVLLPTYIEGYSIVNLDSIDTESWRASGRFNIRQEEKDKAGETTAYEYIFFDVQGGTTVHERLVRVQKIEDRWMIVARPDNPTWSE